MPRCQILPWGMVVFLLLMAQVPSGALAQEDAAVPDPDFEAAIAVDEAETQAPPEGPPSISDAIRGAVPVQTARFIPDISFIVDVGLGWFFHDDHIRQGGHAMDRNGFTLQGLEMAVSGSVDPYFRYDMFFEISHLHLEEAYITTLSLPGNMQIRAGYMNAAFGRQNPKHLHTWNYVNPPLSHTRFMGEEHFSGLGMEISFLLPLPWYLYVGAQVMDTHSETAFRSASFGTVDLTGAGRMDGLEDFLYLARIENFFEITDDWSLSWGLSGAWGQSPWVPDNRVDLYGTEIYLKWRPISSGRDALAVALTVEYLLRRTQVPGDLVLDHGGYAQLDVQFSRNWMIGLRGDCGGILDGISPDVTKLPDTQWRSSASVTLLPTHFSKIRLQYDVGQERGHDLYHGVFLQLEVGVGEHMAHKF